MIDQRCKLYEDIKNASNREERINNRKEKIEFVSLLKLKYYFKKKVGNKNLILTVLIFKTGNVYFLFNWTYILYYYITYFLYKIIGIFFL